KTAKAPPERQVVCLSRNDRSRQERLPVARAQHEVPFDRYVRTEREHRSVEQRSLFINKQENVPADDGTVGDIEKGENSTRLQNTAVQVGHQPTRLRI